MLTNEATEDIKRAYPLEDVLERDGVTRKGQSGNKVYYLCPFHSERRASFVVYRDTNTWYCFGSCQTGGDVFDYVQRRDGIDFRAAYRMLAGEELPPAGGIRAARKMPTRKTVHVAEPPGQEWQAKAWAVVEDCEKGLWSARGGQARAWLHARGLGDETLRRWRIGFNDAGGKRQWSRRLHGIKVWRGITIPIYRAEVIWRLKVRRPAGSAKYMNAMPDGGAFLWGLDSVDGQGRAFVCESEFDAMLLWQEVSGLVGVVAQGSASEAKAVNLWTWIPYLLSMERLYIALDADPAGERAADFWLKRSKRARRAAPSMGIDITDAWRAGVDLRAWVQETVQG